MDLTGKKVAIVATDGVEKIELTSPKNALEQSGATVHLIAPKGKGQIQAWDHDEKAGPLNAERQLDEVAVEEYDMLVLPGGVRNGDKLRKDELAVAVVTDFLDSGKPVAAICHAPWILVETGRMEGRKVTSYHTLATDLRNAGAEWVDEPVVVDRNLITSRKPADLDAFNNTIMEHLAEAVPMRRG